MVLACACLLASGWALGQAGGKDDNDPDRPKTKKSAIPGDDLPQDLRERIRDGLRLLDKKDFEMFVMKIVEPADVEAVLADKPLMDVAKQFRKQRSWSVEQALRFAYEARPTLYNGKTVAAFHLRGVPRNEPQFMYWEKQDGTWYLLNRAPEIEPE
jgi:hypothetical protein